MGEAQPTGGLYGGGFDGAGFPAAVAAAAGAVTDRDLRPRQARHLVQQGGLVGLHLDHQVPARGGDGVGVADLDV